jgi:hypothetical protein
LGFLEFAQAILVSFFCKRQRHHVNAEEHRLSVFRVTKLVPATTADLAPVAQAVMKHFADQDYEVSGDQTGPQCWEIGIHKGGTFQAIIGLKTALRIRIETIGASTQVNAGIGLLESQGISTAVSMLACWPVLVTQTWGLVKQSKLDEEAITVAEKALLAINAVNGSAHFCQECGTAVDAEAAFCPACGVRVQQ